MFIDDNHKRALDSGVIEASANAIHAQQKDPEVCRMGCQIIWSILMKGKHYATHLMSQTFHFLGNKYEATEKTIRTIIKILKRHGKIASIERPSVEILKRQRNNTNNANVIRKEFFHDPELRVHFLKLYGRDIILVVLVLVLTALAVFYFTSMCKK